MDKTGKVDRHGSPLPHFGKRVGIGRRASANQETRQQAAGALFPRVGVRGNRWGATHVGRAAIVRRFGLPMMVCLDGSCPFISRCRERAFA
jgi:hypothetical protein